MIQWTSGSTIQCATGSMNQRNNPHEWLTDWLTGWLNERMDERTNQGINESLHQWTKQPINQWIMQTPSQIPTAFWDLKWKPNSRHTVSFAFCQLLPKVLRACQFFDFFAKPGLNTASSSKCSGHAILFTIFMWNRALATVWSTFCQPHLPKVLRSLPIPWFFVRFLYL